MIKYKCEYTELRDPNTLKPHPDNPNKHPAEQLKVLEANIEQFGWRFPVVESKRSGLVIAGHARRDVAIARDWKVPVDVQHFQSDAEELAVLMSDNIIPELAVMDEELKISALEKLEVADIPLKIIGADDFGYSPSVLDSEDLNQNPGQRMNRNDGAREVVAIGRFIGAADKELTTKATEKLEQQRSVDDAASAVCRLVLEYL